MVLHLIAHPLFKQSDSIAAFYAYGGEMDPALVLKQALALHKKCYLPIIHTQKGNELIFCQIDSKTHYKPNRYGILEPELKPSSVCLAPTELDLVLVPLLAVDKQGHRLGRGGGFYDQTFQLKIAKAKPFLMGIAYTIQCFEQIPWEEHDVSIQGLATEEGVILF